MKTDRISADKPAWLLLVTGAALDTVSITIIKAHFNLLGEIDISSLSAFAGYALRFSEFPVAVIAIIMLMVSPVLPFIAISRIQLTLAYPVLASLHLFFIEIFSHFLLNEPFEVSKAVGVCCILISIFFFYRDSLASSNNNC